MVSLFKLVNDAVHLAFSSSLVLHRVLVGLLLNRAPHTIIKGIAIWGVGWLDIRGDVVNVNFLTVKTGSPTCICIIAPKYVQPGAEEIIVSQSRCKSKKKT